ncbi:MAG: MFS transporter, partial [Alphaproteobacteria bacterium]|nr:MFS transporter [Alphaproteobacteria bacterium]
FLVSLSSRMLYRMMPLLLVAYAGLDNAQAGFLYLFAAIVPLIAGPVAGWLYDHVSPGLVLQTRSLLNAGSSILYVVSPTLTAFALGKLMDKTGTSAFGPAWGALMAGAAAADPKRRADRMAIMSASRDAGNVSGPILAGVLWSLFGPVPMLLARLALAVASGAYTVFLVGWLKRHEADAMAPAAADVRGGGP